METYLIISVVLAVSAFYGFSEKKTPTEWED